MTTVRSAEEIFDHHGRALGAEDLEDIVADYADDAILISQREVFHGTDGARAVFSHLLRDIPQAEWDVDTVFADGALYLEWKARSAGRYVQDGIDTFVFRDGLIRVHTIQYTVRQG